MRYIYIILAALVLSSCEPPCNHSRICGRVVSKFQTGKYNSHYHLGIESDGRPYVAEVGQLTFAVVKEGDQFCGNIGPCP